IPMTGPGPLGKLILAKSDARHRIPRIAYIARRAPKIAAHVGSPFPNIMPAILAKAVDDGTAGGLESVTHLLIDGGHLFVGIQDSRAAPVVLQIVDAPGSIASRVLLFMPVAAFITRACIGPGRAINPELQSLAVNVVGQRFHVREFLVGLDIA